MSDAAAAKSLFDMEPDFAVDISIHNPARAKALKDSGGGRSRGGNSQNFARIRGEDGKMRRLFPKEEVRYRARRATLRDELSFHTHAGHISGVTEIVFRIRASAGWRFDEIPFTFEIDGQQTDGKLGVVEVRPGRNARKVVMRVAGDPTDPNAEFNYTLRYRDKKDNLQEHDPRILNGSQLPLEQSQGDAVDALFGEGELDLAVLSDELLQAVYGSGTPED